MRISVRNRIRYLKPGLRKCVAIEQVQVTRFGCCLDAPDGEKTTADGADDQPGEPMNRAK